MKIKSFRQSARLLAKLQELRWVLSFAANPTDARVLPGGKRAAVPRSANRRFFSVRVVDLSRPQHMKSRDRNEPKSELMNLDVFLPDFFIY